VKDREGGIAEEGRGGSSDFPTRVEGTKKRRGRNSIRKKRGREIAGKKKRTNKSLPSRKKKK